MSDVSGNGIVLIEIGFIRFGPDQQTKWAKHQFKIRYSFIVYEMDLGILLLNTKWKQCGMQRGMMLFVVVKY